MERSHNPFLLIILASLSVLSFALNAKAQVFYPGPTVDLGSNPYSVAAADFNGDNKVDLAVTFHAGDIVGVLIGKGDGTFLSKVIYATGSYPRSVTTGDFNGDNKVDLATANYNGGTVSVLIGNGDGTFSPNVDYTTGIGPYSVTTGDFNGDNKVDLAVANYNDNTVSVLIGNGDGTFSGKVDYPTWYLSRPSSVTTDDFNGDNKVDLVAANYNSTLVSVLIGNGDGTLMSKVDYTTGTGPYSVTTGDFNGDNKPDLATANYTSNTVSVLIGKGDGTFFGREDYATGSRPSSVTTGDFNGDNKPDLASANYTSNTVSVLIGKGDGTFFGSEDYATGLLPTSVTTGDFNGDNKPDLAVTNSSSRTVSILINQASWNQPPSDISLSNLTVNENSSVGTVVGILSATDPNPGETFTFSELNDPDNKFSVVGNEVRVEGALDFETATSHAVTIRVTDSGNLTYDEQFVITINNVNEAPTNITLSNSSVNENTPVGTVVGTLTATDPDAGATFTFSEMNDPDSRFAVVGNELRTDGVLDFETGASHSVTIGVTDNGGLTYDKQFTITVNDVNEAPTDITLDNTSVAENSPAGTVVGTFSTSDPEGGSFTYTLVPGSGSTDNGSFVIAGAQLKTNAAIDYETKNSFSIRVHSQNGGGLFVEKVFTVTATNVNEAPTDIALSNSSVNENTPVGTVVGTLMATDPDAGATFTFSEMNDPDSKFAVVGNELRVGGALDFEAGASHSVTIRVSDNGGRIYDKQFSITVNDVNEAPTDITLDHASVAENSAAGTLVGTFNTSDPEGGSFAYSLYSGWGDADNGSFVIVGAQLTTNAVFDYETKNSFSIRVHSENGGGLFVEKVFTVTATNVNEAPTDIALSNSSVNENTPLGTVIGAFTAVDPDGGATFTFSEITDPEGKFSVVGNELRTDGALDFEAVASHSVTIRVSDNGGLTYDKQFTITVNNVNEAPIDITLDNTSVAENSPLGTLVGTFSTSDPEGGSFTYSLVPGLGDANNGSFVIVGAQLMTNAAIDYETKNSFSIRVHSQNGGVLFVEKVFTITATNVNEAPTDIALSNSSVNENTPVGTVVGTLTATDPDAGATFTFSEITDPDSKFSVVGNELRTDGALDFETAASHSVTIRVSDNGGLTYDRQFTVTVNDVNEAPPNITITAPVDPVAVNTTVVVSATISGGNIGDIDAAIWKWGDGTPGADGTVSAANVSGSHIYTAAGVYTVELTVADKNNNTATGTFEYVVVYDPSAGFVTGGGWVISPPGAVPAIPALTGKATFGFVSKYLKGKTVPTGNTEFQFKLANLNFSSTGYEWLVVTGARAQYKGSGTINNTGSYGFMLAAIDGQVNGGGGTDKFRIKIWDRSQGDLIVYDNKMDAPDDADPTTVISGGSIVIHKSLAKEPAASPIPTVFALHQCYPNPFNPSTTITYALPVDAYVSLAVYNTLGQNVAQLVDEAMSAGIHDVVLDASQLASGLYICRLHAGDFVQTRKLLLLK